jgi:hypothetical protein
MAQSVAKRGGRAIATTAFSGATFEGTALDLAVSGCIGNHHNREGNLGLVRTAI